MPTPGLAAPAPGYLELLEEFVVDPRSAARLVRQYKPMRAGFISFVAAALSVALAERLAGSAFSAVPLGIVIALACLWRVLAGMTSAAVFHMAAEFGGGEGSAEGLFILFGMSALVWTMLLPAALIMRALAWDGWLVSSLMITSLSIAQLVLKARSLRDNYGVSTAAAWGILVLPYVVAVFLVVAVVMLFVAGAAVAFMHVVR